MCMLCTYNLCNGVCVYGIPVREEIHGVGDEDSDDGGVQQLEHGLHRYVLHGEVEQHRLLLRPEERGPREQRWQSTMHSCELVRTYAPT